MATALSLVVIAGFVAFAVQTSLTVRAGRHAVETRVGWLRELGTMSRALHACGPERDAMLGRANEIGAALGSDPIPLAGACDEAHLSADRAAIGGLESAARRETGQLSASLGEEVDHLFWVAIAACFTAFLLGVLLVVLGRMRRTLGVQADTLAQQALEMADRERALRTSAAIIAHEINNPLMFLRMSTELARRDLTSSESDREKDQSIDELLDAAIEAGDRIGIVARDLRDLGRQDPAVVEPVDVAELIEQTQRLIASSRARSFLSVDLTRVPRVHANGARLGQVLLNLLRNAEDAAQHAAQPRISLRVFPCDEWVHIEVADNGPGISEVVRARLFTPFVTTKGARGTGLGLYVSRTIVESFGGHLTLSSEPMAGTVATIRLPISSAARSA